MFNGIVYKVTNTVNGKCYIGQTIYSLEKRKYSHLYAIKIGRNPTSAFYNAIKKYGKEKFQWEIVKECNSKEILNLMETFMIMVHKSHISENGYNLTWGGNSITGYKHTKKECKNRSLRQMGTNNSAYYRQTTNNVAKDPLVRKKLSIASSGKRNGMYGDHRFAGKNNPMYGKSMTNKKYKIIFPDKHFIEILGLKNFCRDNNLPYDKIRWYCKNNKEYKGWRIEKCLMD